MKFTESINLLIIEDESYDVNRIKRTLKPFENRLIIKDVVADGQSAINLLLDHHSDYDVIIMDYQIVGPLTGEKLINKIKSIDPFVQIIVVTKMTVNITDFDFANRLIEAGAVWFCTKYPSDIQEYVYQPTDFLLSILNAYERKKLSYESSKSNSQLNKSVNNILNKKRIIGESPVIKKLLKQIEKASQQDATVFISGPSGTGKELVAYAIHANSKRKNGPFVKFNCAAIPRELVESELFGHEKGAFTGAEKRKIGKLEFANDGTLFLDEIGDMNLEAQAKVLRVIQEGKFERVGGNDTIDIDVRILAATNKNLEQMIDGGSFREDLFYRLNVIPLDIPPLRERHGDIPVLVNYYLEYFAHDLKTESKEISDEAMALFKTYDFPGNIRELRNLIERLYILSGGEVIEASDVRPQLAKSNGTTGSDLPFLDTMDFSDARQEFEIYYLKKQLEKYDWNISEVAEHLGMAQPNLSRKIKQLGIEKS